MSKLKNVPKIVSFENISLHRRYVNCYLTKALVSLFKTQKRLLFVHIR